MKIETLKSPRLINNRACTRGGGGSEGQSNFGQTVNSSIHRRPEAALLFEKQNWVIAFNRLYFQIWLLKIGFLLESLSKKYIINNI